MKYQKAHTLIIVISRKETADFFKENVRYLQTCRYPIYLIIGT